MLNALKSGTERVLKQYKKFVISGVSFQMIDMIVSTIEEKTHILLYYSLHDIHVIIFCARDRPLLVRCSYKSESYKSKTVH